MMHGTIKLKNTVYMLSAFGQLYEDVASLGMNQAVHKMLSDNTQE